MSTITDRDRSMVAHPSALRAARVREAARPTHLRLVQPGEARPAAVPTAGEAPLRLTRRGRAVLRALVVLVLAGLMTVTALVMAHRADAAVGGGAPAVTQQRVVMPGETLWGIAGELAPRADRRDTVAVLVEVNHLPTAAVQAGQVLAIPPQLARH